MKRVTKDSYKVISIDKITGRTSTCSTIFHNRYTAEIFAHGKASMSNFKKYYYVEAI